MGMERKNGENANEVSALVFPSRIDVFQNIQRFHEMKEKYLHIHGSCIHKITIAPKWLANFDTPRYLVINRITD